VFSSLIVIPSNNVPYNVDTLWLCRGGATAGEDLSTLGSRRRTALSKYRQLHKEKHSRKRCDANTSEFSDSCWHHSVIVPAQAA
jgi:hypothetical protein